MICAARGIFWNRRRFNALEPICAPSSDAVPGTDTPSTLRPLFLWLNNFQYAVTDKLSLSVQANWTRLVSLQQLNPGPDFPITSVSHQWMSFGCRADYGFDKNGSVFTAFEHDAFNINFDDYRIRAGVSYNF